MRFSQWNSVVAAATAVWVSGVSAGAVAEPQAQADCAVTWSPMQDVNIPGAALTRTPLIRVDDEGWATVAWSEMDADKTERLLVSRRPPGGAWQAPQQVATTYSSVPFFSDLDLAVGTGGHALLTWRRENPRHRIRPWVAYFDPATGWSAPVDLQVAGYDVTNRASVAVNASGEGIVSWAAGAKMIFARRYRLNEGWSRVERVEDPKFATVSLNTRSAINDAGDAAVAWVGWQPTVARYDHAAGGWQPIQRLAQHGEVKDGFVPELAMTPAGDVFAAWTEKLSWDTRVGIMVAHYAPGLGWKPTVRVSGHSYRANVASVAANAQGEALVAWHVNPTIPVSKRVEAARYVPSQGWGEPVRIEVDALLGTSLPSFGENGEFTVTSVQRYAATLGDRDYPKIAAYTMSPPDDAVVEDAILELGHEVTVSSSPGGHVAALGTVHKSDWQPSKGQMRASVRERSCSARSGAAR